MIGGPWALGRGSQAEAGWAGPSQRALPHRRIWISLTQRQKTRRVHEQELVASITYQMSVLFLLTPYLKPQFRLLNQSGTNQDWLSSCNNWDLRWETRV